MERVSEDNEEVPVDGGEQEWAIPELPGISNEESPFSHAGHTAYEPELETKEADGLKEKEEKKDEAVNGVEGSELIKEQEEIQNDLNNNAVTSNGRKYSKEEPSSDGWRNHHKHVFLLSWAGRPIYSRYGDESELAGLMGVMQAMISFGEDEKDPLRALIAGEHKIVFVQKGPIYCVCVARTYEPLSHIVRELDYMVLQIISTLTGGVLKVMKTRPTFDIRNLLGGSDKFLDSLMSWMDHDISLHLGGIMCLSLDPILRKEIGSIILSERVPEMFCGIVLSGHKLVNLLRPKNHILNPAGNHFGDQTSIDEVTFEGLKNTESWAPLCLPKFKEEGYLYAHISYFAEDLSLILVSTSAEGFYALANAKQKIVQKFKDKNVIPALLRASSKEGTYTAGYSVVINRRSDGPRIENSTIVLRDSNSAKMK